MGVPPDRVPWPTGVEGEERAGEPGEEAAEAAAGRMFRGPGPEEATFKGDGGGRREGLSMISSSNFFRLMARELRLLFPGGSGSGAAAAAAGGLWRTRDGGFEVPLAFLEGELTS